MEDYEKKYKNALEKAKSMIDDLRKGEDILAVSDLEEMFPELKNKDEEIRKAIIEFFELQDDNTTYSLIPKKDILAWLEKQCYTKKDIDDAYLKGISDAKHELEKQGTPAKLSEEEQNSFAKGVLSNCALSFINYLDAHSYEGKMCVSNGECEDIDYAFHNAMWDRLHRYYCKYIEKQGEQKPIMNVPTREVILSIWDLGNEWKELTNGSISTEYGTQLDYIQKHWYESEYYLREKQGEQNPAVVDFNAKDWYVSKVDGKIHDMTYNPTDKVEPFDKYEGLTDFERTLADICIGWIGEELGWKQYIKDNADVLLKIAIKKFNSIQDASFEQKPADKNATTKQDGWLEIPFGAKDSELQESTYYIPKGFHAEIDDDKVVIKKDEKSAAWSDEDENYLQSAENACEYQYGKNTSTILWLKSLKDRIGGKTWQE